MRGRPSVALLAVLLTAGALRAERVGAAAPVPARTEIMAATAPALPAGGVARQQADPRAAPSDTTPHPGAALRVFLLTLGRGDAIWEKFGHNALWIEDTVTGEGAAYNWGIFRFDQVGFIPRLIKGTMLYSMEPHDPYATLEDAQLDDRRVWIQELALTPGQRWDLLSFVHWNAQPENKEYRYDYYRDNCSTRVRDALDRVLGGAIRAETQDRVASRTYRWHTRRLLQDVPAAYLGIQTVLGPNADRPLSAWEEMFLPTRLMEEVRGITVADPEGGVRPLVMQERALRDSGRPAEPARPPFALPWFLGVGLLWGGGMVMLVRRGKAAGPPLRAAAAALAGGWALLAGLAGNLLLGAWLFTDHTFWYRNLNLLQLNPISLLLVPAFLVYLIRGRVPWWGRDLAGALAVLSVVGALMQLIPGLGQGNGEVLALTLPVNLGVWMAARTVAERRLRVRAPEEVQAPETASPA